MMKITFPIPHNEQAVQVETLYNIGLSYVIPMGNCRSNCPECHSSHYHIGAKVDKVPLDNILSQLAILNRRYKGRLQNVTIFGGDNNEDVNSSNILTLIKRLHELDYKVFMFSSSEHIEPKYKEVLDGYKEGLYRPELGGLDSPDTNQRMVIKE